MKLNEKRNWGNIWYEAKMKNFNITIDQQHNKKWYFYLLREKDDLKYNSLWEGKEYNDKESCVTAIEEWINNNA
jgi:hypothetical protein